MVARPPALPCRLPLESCAGIPCHCRGLERRPSWGGFGEERTAHTQTACARGVLHGAGSLGDPRPSHLVTQTGSSAASSRHPAQGWNSCRTASPPAPCPGTRPLPVRPASGPAPPTLNAPVGCREGQKEQGRGPARWESKPRLRCMRAVWPQVQSLLSGPAFLPCTTWREASACGTERGSHEKP